MEYQLTDLDRRRLLAARDAAQNLQEAEDALKELELKSISSPNMDGMPRPQGAGDASAQYLIHLEYARKERDKAQHSLDKAKHNAMRVCRKLSGHMRKFCEAYYAQCFPFDIAQTLSGVQRSRCYDYINAVKGQAAEIGPNRT